MSIVQPYWEPFQQMKFVKKIYQGFKVEEKAGSANMVLDLGAIWLRDGPSTTSVQFRAVLSLQQAGGGAM